MDGEWFDYFFDFPFTNAFWLFANIMDSLMLSIQACSSMAVEAANMATYRPKYMAGTLDEDQHQTETSQCQPPLASGIHNPERVGSSHCSIFRRMLDGALRQIDFAFQFCHTVFKPERMNC